MGWFERNNDGGDDEGLEVPADANPVDFLMALFRDRTQPMTRRLRAAIECAPYVHSTFRATAIIQGGDFASRLERAVSRSKGNAVKVIEAKPSSEGEGSKLASIVEVRAPLPRAAEKRYRRW